MEPSMQEEESITRELFIKQKGKRSRISYMDCI